MSGDVSVRLLQKKDYQFNIFFDESLPPILGDEPPPLGEGLGPSPAHFLAIAVGNCLIDSLRFALVKFKRSVDELCKLRIQVGKKPVSIVPSIASNR